MRDVIVIGAGFAGIAAARQLRDRGLRVLVVEARDRIGGRALTDRSSGEAVDLGGQWIGPGQTRVAALAAEVDMTTYPTWTAGRSLLLDSRGRAQVLTPIPSLSVMTHGLAAVPALLRLDRLARRVNPARPWSAPDAAALDGVTVTEWLHSSVRSAEARSWVDAIVRGVVSHDLDQVSLLYLAAEVSGSGGVASVIGIEGGAQQDVFVDGAGRLVERLAEGLEVVLASPVTEISQESDHVRVIATGAVHRARRVILAAPPAQVQAIVHAPALPAPLAQWLGGMRMGSVAKFVALYERPFWRERGLSGSVLLPSGPATAVVDVTRPGGPGRLCILACGGDAAALMALEPEERCRRILDAVRVALGEQARTPTAWLEKLWDEDPWTLGGYSASPPPGAVARLTAAPWAAVGRLHFAGTETADLWPGYFEGAIRSGERAADETERELAREGTPSDR